MKVLKFGMVSHMNMANEGILTYAGIIEDKNHVFNGKNLVKQTTTPKTNGVWGTGKTEFFIEGETESYPTFKDLHTAYNFTPYES